ncbi:MAG: hypothetical protein RLZZ396_690, partial [Planctomycetota bacterium]
RRAKENKSEKDRFDRRGLRIYSSVFHLFLCSLIGESTLDYTF